MYQFYLNNELLIDQPDGFESFVESVTFDEEKRGFVLTNPLELFFTGQGYEIIKSRVDTIGFCGDLPFLIKSKCSANDNYTTIFTGIVRLSTITFINHFGTNNDNSPNNCRVKVNIIDSGYMANINNNRKIKVDIEANRSKNGVAITPITPITITTAGSTIAAKSYRIYDVLRFLVSWMSDNTIAFDSDYFTNLTTANSTFAITTGSRLRPGASDIVPTVSFDECILELYKKFNIIWDINSDNLGNYTLIVEPQSYFENELPSVALNNVNDVEVSLDMTKNYSGVNLGSKHVKYNPALDHNYPPIQFIAFKEETYSFIGTCNTSNVLDLVSDWRIDNNLIRQLVFDFTPDDDNYDSNIFLLEYLPATSALYKKTVQLGVDIFNDNLRTEVVVGRFNLQADLAMYAIGNDNSNVATLRGSDLSYNAVHAVPQTFDIIFTSEISDPSSSYNSTTGVFTAPFDGLFSFDVTQAIIVDISDVLTTAATAGARSTWWLYQVVINGGTAIPLDEYFGEPVLDGFSTWRSENSLPIGDGIIRFIGAPRFFLNSGDTLKFQVVLTPVLVDDLTPVDTNFPNFYRFLSTNNVYQQIDYEAGYYVSQGTSSTTGLGDLEYSFLSIRALSYAGGIFQGYDSSVYNNIMLKFTHPLRNDIWKAIIDNKGNAIYINSRVKAWIRSISRNTNTGSSELELVTNYRLLNND